VRSLTVLGGGAAEVVELRVGPQARVAGKSLMQVRFPRGAIVCALVKSTGVVVPRGSDIIEPGDTAVVLTTPEAFDAMSWHFKKGLF
jgi:trk system potassium uptake protein TrkA